MSRTIRVLVVLLAVTGLLAPALGTCVCAMPSPALGEHECCTGDGASILVAEQECCGREAQASGPGLTVPVVKSLPAQAMTLVPDVAAVPAAPVAPHSITRLISEPPLILRI